MSWVSIWLRGLAMGAADAVPGVSGGTVAFLTGIYDRWLSVLTAVTPELWAVFRHDGIRGLWIRLDGAFVLPLLIGILMSLITLAHWIRIGIANRFYLSTIRRRASRIGVADSPSS